MSDLPVRFSNRFNLTVPSSDWRAHPDTPIGDHYFYGNGVVHHDLVNVPFYGQLYDTAVIAHPLSASDYLSDTRIKITHIQFVMSQLRDIQRYCRSDRRTTLGELRARQDSIEVLDMLRRKVYERLRARYLAQKANGAAKTETAGQECAEDVPVEVFNIRWHADREHETMARAEEEKSKTTWFASEHFASYQ